MKFDARTAPGGTLRDWIDHRADTSPDRISHIFPDDGALTWVQLREEASTVARGLAGLGAAPGDSVATMLPNGRAGVLTLFGLLYGGFRATPINLAAGPEAIGYALGHSGARYVFLTEAQRDLFDAALCDHPNAIAPLPAPWSPDPAPDTPLPPVAPGDDALLIYTSGTTGRPKGVVHSQSSLLAGGWTPSLAHALSPQDRALCVLPIYHINGLCVTIMGPLVSGGSVIVCPRFSATRFWQDCAAHQATWFSVVPTILSHLLHGDDTPDEKTRQRLRFARSASAPLAPEVQTAFETRFAVPIVETMGLTETAAQMLSNPLPPGLRKIGSSGIAIGNETAILGPDHQPVPPGTEGEIAVRGANVMRAYLDNPDATARTFTADGWLLTGDLGRMDGDGYVFVTGRLKELIIKGGENIAPREVDEALYAHPDVVEAAGFARPCPTYGERVEAAVRLRPDATVSTDDLLALCRARLGAFKSPDRIFILDDLPKGPSGKIQRLRLAELCEPQATEVAAQI